MKVIRSINNLANTQKNCAVTIGNFDGIHKGHTSLINKIISYSKKYSLVPTVITFEPLPEEYFQKANFKRLMRLKEKLLIFKEHGIKQVLCLNFNKRFSKISAEEFISMILIQKLDTKYLIVGSDFRFGHNREGNYNLLKSYSKKTEMKVENIKLINTNGNKIGSTRIREALSSGDVELANKLIGRPFSISGMVVHGEKLGKKLGYPTANIDIYKSYPINGIFLVKISMENDADNYGLASLGNKPTFSGKNDVLEVYIFNFNKNIYNQKLKISFLHKIRDQIKFSSKSDLIKQMDYDYKIAMELTEKLKNEL
ncbi:MAG: bifunctional riboflavin kinase/FAD synthetase [Pelagibacterales bacterium]|nr:bifunctional riboflavin kinase/FAD synthetase [Pelagibacterales bacterium]|tara:strand:+ start:11201 stop:12136 length:936 start_codon:yes stop_codon:yes gene_type:complete